MKNLLNNTLVNRSTFVQSTRTGAIVPMVAITIPILIAFIALAVDYGIIVVARQELQNAADAAAVATLQTLQSSPDDADLAGFETITSNTLLGKSIDFDIGQSIEYGNWDQDTLTFVPIARNGSPSTATDTNGDSIPSGASAVRVTLIRSKQNGNGIRLFFGPVIGTEFADQQVQAIAAGTPGCSGFVGIDSVDLRNNLITDSYNSDEGPYATGWGWGNPSINRRDNGDICSNGPVDLASGADIYGNASGSPVTIAGGSGATISGTIGSTTLPSYPPVDFDEANINNNDMIERGPTWAPEYLTPARDLIVNNGRHLTLESGVYLFRDMKLQGGGSLTIDGDVTIYIEREMVFDNGTVANLGGIPNDFNLLVGAGPANVQGGNSLFGVIYAPAAEVNIANGGGFFGSIIAKDLIVAGGAGLHFDESLADEANAGGPPRLVF